MGKERHKNRQYLLTVLSLLVCLMFSVVPIHAQTGSLTFTNSWVTSGHTFYLYKIADFDQDHLTVRSDYSSVVDVSHSSSDSSYWSTAASNVVTVINNNSIAAASSATSGDQSVTFSNIELGLYLVTSDSFQTTVGSKYYSAAPTLVSVPKNTADTVYSVTAELKPTITDVPETPVTPSTPTTPSTTTSKKTNTKKKKTSKTKKTTTSKKKKSSTSTSSGDGSNSGNKTGNTSSSADGAVDDGKTGKTSTSTTGGSDGDTSKNKNTQTSTTVKTGDTTKISIYVVLLVISGFVLLMMVNKLKMKVRGKR